MAGGSGSRLEPLTRSVNKHLLPVYDKPMIYYPLTTLMLGGLREFLIVTAPHHVEQFQALLGDGCASRHLDRLQGAGQGRAALPSVSASAGPSSRDAMSRSSSATIFSTGQGSLPWCSGAFRAERGATILGYEVKDLSAFGAVTLAPDGTPDVAGREAARGRSAGLAVPGLYFYDEQALDIAARQKPSGRGEMEITDVNRAYLEMGELNVEKIQRGIAWLDGGTPDDLFEAGQFVRVLEERTGMRIACPEEVAFRKGFIGVDGLRAAISACPRSKYRSYLEMIANSLAS